ncbi:Uncharacterised protein [Mycobacterium tuberculosis]|nr:Uncharacterised protein [Mycobacterium tuberculosis]CKQ44529.1 Uncharacterised protein [Mycobacterium tuberculosis]CKS10799.1 Uncharacterised protein [Mycobacterium tuberculosis]CNW15715.1 Uncharacterised protein [Mycobacterium tuberculosis]COX27130.1 Uncharacterised protein [Mycobacterium tuberculosis]
MRVKFSSPSAMPNTCCRPGVSAVRTRRASSGSSLDPPTCNNRSDFGVTGSHSQDWAHSLASAGTNAVTVTPWRSMAAKAASGLGSGANTAVAPTVIAPSRPGQASGKLWPAASTTR